MIDDQLPEDLAELFAAERAAPVAAGGAKAIVKAKLAASVAAVPLGAGVLGAAGKLIGVLALGVGIGAGAIAVSRGGGDPVAVPTPARVEMAAPGIEMRVQPDSPSVAIAATPDPRPVERPVPPLRRPPTKQAAAAAVEVPVTVADVAAAETSPVAPPSSPEVVTAVPPTTASEAALLAQAWSAMSRRDAARALAIVRDANRTYPAGPLFEEREAIRISALSQLRRRDETRAAAMQFLASYPRSIHRPLVERALQESR